MMQTAIRLSVATLMATCAVTVAPAQPAKKPKFTAAPGADLRQPIIWGSECVALDDTGLRFGGQDQKADDGCGHTEIKVDGQWKGIVEELRKANPLQGAHDQLDQECAAVAAVLARCRFIYFQGLEQADTNRELAATVEPLVRKLGRIPLKGELGKVDAADAYFKRQAELAAAGPYQVQSPDNEFGMGATQADIEVVAKQLTAYRQLAELLDCEPAPRALSPIAYDAKSKLFVIFGGDHLDYMTNDTWVFDPAKKRWEMRHPKTAPPPRANHTLTATGDGKVKLSGGFCHNNTDIWYMGPLYQFVDDGDWTYDVAADAWTSEAGAAGVEPNQRAYRTLLFFLPEGFLKGDKPDAAANEAKLKALPANTWVAMNPPVKPRMNRDWGSACIATDYDVLLRWSGGHSAHGGSDVPMYHFATNRWELPFPVEFPLGQCYSNTSYPTGFNFNRRPWVSGHTYKNFGYDPAGKVMVFTGHNPWSYIFDPKVGDWTGRSEKPAGMNYGGSFYTLTLCTTDKELYCWGGQYGHSVGMHKWQSGSKTWQPVKTTGAALPCPAVDHSGLAFDAKRNRLILFPKTYKDTILAMGCATNGLSELKPGGDNGAAATVGFWRELAYVPDADLILLVGSSLAPAGEGPEAIRPSLAYDCAANEWKVLNLGGVHPAGKGGRNVSLGAVYDPRRKLVWATDTNSEVYVLRLDVKAAGAKG